jgi:hypothetical protein
MTRAVSMPLRLHFNCDDVQGCLTNVSNVVRGYGRAPDRFARLWLCGHCPGVQEGGGD